MIYATKPGEAGGGKILVGGTIAAQSHQFTAQSTSISPLVTLLVNAITTGNAGTIAILANNTTLAYGKFSATGGYLSENGGYLETSASNLDAFGIEVNLFDSRQAKQSGGYFTMGFVVNTLLI